MSEHVLTDTFFQNFDLHPLLQQGLDGCGFTRCTPIQELTLPVALAGRDVAGQAQTGTGKTCAFLVTVMNHLLTKPARAARKDTDPRALVIAPTRELAIQIDKDARAIGAQTGLKTALIYGGVDYDKQRQALRDGSDIVIATPGRMLDYYKQRVFGLDNVEVMVVDEADRMFDLGFIKDVRYIFRRLPPREERQVLMYSATLSHRVLELAYEHMHEAEKLVAATDHVTADRVRQVIYFPSKEEKPPLLLNLLAREKPSRALVFVNTRAQTERVRDRLQRHGYRAGGLSGDVPQVKRQKLLQRFKDGQLDILVCTDVAARGLHIPHVSHVFNYDLPQDAEDYVHRIGRTARMDEDGDAISFACDLYAMSLPDIEQYIEQKIPVATVEPELLVMPKAPPASERMQAGGGGEHAAAAHKSHRGGRNRSPGHGGSHHHADARKPQAHQPEAVKTPAEDNNAPRTASADSPSTANGGAGTGQPRTRRRHRGGRKHHRAGQGGGQQARAQGGQSTSTGSSESQPRKPTADQHGERTAARHQSATHDNGSRRRRPSGAAPTPPHPQPAPTPVAAQKRPGILRRLFGGR